MGHSQDTSPETPEPNNRMAKASVPDAVAKERLRLWLRMLRCTTRIENHLRQRLRTNFGITLPQFDLLAALDRAGRPMTMSELSEYLLVSNGNVTGVVQRLAAEGWVELHRAPPDRRTQRVLLTKDGEWRFQEMAQVHQGWIAELLAGAAPHEEELEQHLLRIRRALPEGRTDKRTPAETL